jgi:hypothetical protein
MTNIRKKLNSILIVAMISIWMFSSVTTAQNKVVVIPLGDTPEEPVSKLIFVTEQTWKGKLGGVEGAHAKCVTEAKSRGISGRFQALLGTAGRSPVTRANHYSLNYLRLPDGETLRSSYHSLFQSLDNKILATGSAVVWTGLGVDGRPDGMENCAKWTSKLVGDKGRVGEADQYDLNWVSARDDSCGQFRSLYCIEQ